MKTHVEQLDGNSVRLTVTVTADEVDEAIDAAYKSIAKKIKVPGFRAGKAPKPVIDTHVGREAVIGDAQDELLTKSYSDALDAENIRPISQPEIGEIEPLAPGTDFEYSAEVEVRPELELSSVEGISITVPSQKASEKDIDEQIDTMRERFATLEPVSDRGVEADDFALVSFVGRVDGEEYDGNTVDKYLYEMNRGLMPPAFDEGLVGTEVGQERLVEFEIPPSPDNPEYGGKTVSFDVTVHEIKARVLPEVDNEFAFAVGGFDTVDELRESAREQLDNQKQMAFRRAREDNARRAIAERLEGDIPEAMIETTRGQMKRDFENGLQAREMTPEQYFAQTGMTPDELEEQLREQAEQSVREELALEALYRSQGLEVTDEDIDIELALFSVGSGESTEDARKKWEDMGVMPAVIEQIQHKKATMWMLDNIEITEESDDDAGDDTDAGTKPKSKKRKRSSAKKTEAKGDESADDAESSDDTDSSDDADSAEDEAKE